MGRASNSVRKKDAEATAGKKKKGTAFQRIESLDALLALFNSTDVDAVTKGFARFRAHIEADARKQSENDDAASSSNSLLLEYAKVSPRAAEISQLWNDAERDTGSELHFQLISLVATITKCGPRLGCRALAHALGAAAVRQHLRDVHSSLGSGRASLQAAMLRILQHAAAQSPTMAREVYQSIDFGSKSFARIAGKRFGHYDTVSSAAAGVESGKQHALGVSVRAEFLRLIAVILDHGDPALNSEVLGVSAIAAGLFRGLVFEEQRLFERIIRSLYINVLASDGISRMKKAEIFNSPALDALAQVFATAHRRRRRIVSALLQEVLASPDGIAPPERSFSLGRPPADGPQRSTMVLRFLARLRPAADISQAILCARILRAHRELYVPYLAASPPPLDPQPTEQFARAAAFIERLAPVAGVTAGPAPPPARARHVADILVPPAYARMHMGRAASVGGRTLAATLACWARILECAAAARRRCRGAAWDEAWRHSVLPVLLQRVPDAAAIITAATSAEQASDSGLEREKEGATFSSGDAEDVIVGGIDVGTAETNGAAANDGETRRSHEGTGFDRDTVHADILRCTAALVSLSPGVFGGAHVEARSLIPSGEPKGKHTALAALRLVTALADAGQPIPGIDRILALHRFYRKSEECESTDDHVVLRSGSVEREVGGAADGAGGPQKSAVHRSGSSAPSAPADRAPPTSERPEQAQRDRADADAAVSAALAVALGRVDPPLWFCRALAAVCVSHAAGNSFADAIVTTATRAAAACEDIAAGRNGTATPAYLACLTMALAACIQRERRAPKSPATPGTEAGRSASTADAAAIAVLVLALAVHHGAVTRLHALTALHDALRQAENAQNTANVSTKQHVMTETDDGVANSTLRPLDAEQDNDVQVAHIFLLASHLAQPVLPFVDKSGLMKQIAGSLPVDQSVLAAVKTCQEHMGSAKEDGKDFASLSSLLDLASRLESLHAQEPLSAAPRAEALQSMPATSNTSKSRVAEWDGVLSHASAEKVLQALRGDAPDPAPSMPPAPLPSLTYPAAQGVVATPRTLSPATYLDNSALPGATREVLGSSLHLAGDGDVCAAWGRAKLALPELLTPGSDPLAVRRVLVCALEYRYKCTGVHDAVVRADGRKKRKRRAESQTPHNDAVEARGAHGTEQAVADAAFCAMLCCLWARDTGNAASVAAIDDAMVAKLAGCCASAEKERAGDPALWHHQMTRDTAEDVLRARFPDAGEGEKDCAVPAHTHWAAVDSFVAAHSARAATVVLEQCKSGEYPAMAAAIGRIDSTGQSLVVIHRSLAGETSGVHVGALVALGSLWASAVAEAVISGRTRTGKCSSHDAAPARRKRGAEAAGETSRRSLAKAEIAAAATATMLDRAGEDIRACSHIASVAGSYLAEMPSLWKASSAAFSSLASTWGRCIPAFVMQLSAAVRRQGNDVRQSAAHAAVVLAPGRVILNDEMRSRACADALGALWRSCLRRLEPHGVALALDIVQWVSDATATDERRAPLPARTARDRGQLDEPAKRSRIASSGSQHSVRARADASSDAEDAAPSDVESNAAGQSSDDESDRASGDGGYSSAASISDDDAHEAASGARKPIATACAEEGDEIVLPLGEKAAAALRGAVQDGLALLSSHSKFADALEADHARETSGGARNGVAALLASCLTVCARHGQYAPPTLQQMLLAILDAPVEGSVSACLATVPFGELVARGVFWGAAMRRRILAERGTGEQGDALESDAERTWHCLESLQPDAMRELAGTLATQSHVDSVERNNASVWERLGFGAAHLVRETQPCAHETPVAAEDAAGAPALAGRLVVAAACSLFASGSWRTVSIGARRLVEVGVVSVLMCALAVRDLPQRAAAARALAHVRAAIAADEDFRERRAVDAILLWLKNGIRRKHVVPDGVHSESSGVQLDAKRDKETTSIKRGGSSEQDGNAGRGAELGDGDTGGVPAHAAAAAAQAVVIAAQPAHPLYMHVMRAILSHSSPDPARPIFVDVARSVLADATCGADAAAEALSLAWRCGGTVEALRRSHAHELAASAALAFSPTVVHVSTDAGIPASAAVTALPPDAHGSIADAGGHAAVRSAALRLLAASAPRDPTAMVAHTAGMNTDELIEAVFHAAAACASMPPRRRRTIRHGVIGLASLAAALAHRPGSAASPKGAGALAAAGAALLRHRVRCPVDPAVLAARMEEAASSSCRMTACGVFALATGVVVEGVTSASQSRAHVAEVCLRVCANVGTAIAGASAVATRTYMWRALWRACIDTWRTRAGSPEALRTVLAAAVRRGAGKSGMTIPAVADKDLLTNVVVALRTNTLKLDPEFSIIDGVCAGE